jgi:hypothetical protein
VGRCIPWCTPCARRGCGCWCCRGVMSRMHCVACAFTSQLS